MLFSDLPGEWTSAFINSSLAGDKLHFLRRADALVLAFRADHLRDSHTRHSQYQSARLLLQRLRESGFTSPNTPLIIAVTRADLVERVLPPAAHEIASTAQDLGFTDVPTIAIASFSANPSVPSGLGLGDLLKTLLRLTRSRVSGARRERGERLFDLYKHRAQVV
jgi:hypothetical protein